MPHRPDVASTHTAAIPWVIPVTPFLAIGQNPGKPLPRKDSTHGRSIKPSYAITDTGRNLLRIPDHDGQTSHGYLIVDESRAWEDESGPVA